MFSIGVKYFASSIQRGRLKNVLWLTILSLSINIGVLITGVALIRGFESQCLDKILHVHGHAQVYPCRKMPIITNKPLPESSLLKKFPQFKKMLNNILEYLQIKQYSGTNLIYTIPKLEMQGGMAKNSRTEGVIIRGLEQADAKYLLGNYMKSGDLNLQMTGTLQPVIMGHRLARRIRATVGAEVDLVLRVKDEVESVPCKVTGIFDYGFSELDNNMIFTRADLVKEYSNASSAILYVDNPAQVDEYIASVKQMDPSLYIESWQQQNKVIQEMFTTQIRAVYMLIGLYILSGIVQSLSSLYILLSERIYDIGVLTMLGMTHWQKYAIFVTYGTLISVTNTILGVFFGIALSLLYPYIKNIYESLTGLKIIHQDALWISEFNTKLLISDITNIACSTLIIMSLAMIIAAHFVSRSNTIRSIKE